MRPIVFLFACVLSGACAAPMDQMPRLSEAELADDAPVLGAVPQPTSETLTGGGIFSALFKKKAGEAQAATTPETPDMVLADGAAPLPDPAPSDTLSEAAAEPPKRPGLLALFQPKAAGVAPEAVPAALTPAEDDPVLAPEELGVAAELPGGPVEDPVAPQKRKGLFSGFGTRANAPAAAGAEGDVLPGTVLPYGIVARACDLPTREMGKKIAQYPERRARHVLYDSDPGNTGPHTFYLTGFTDGCARQFTASLAMFGTVEMHEQLRYGLPAEVQPYSDTDKAYEKLKSRVCKVGRKKPCGSRIGKLEGDTVFLSIYERFGENSRWSNLLLHGGEMLAHDTKGG